MDSPLLTGMLSCTCGDSATVLVSRCDGSGPSSRLDSHKLARSKREYFGFSSGLISLPRLENSTRRRTRNVRCLYSPLVESLEASKYKIERPRGIETEGQARTLSTPSPLDDDNLSYNRVNSLQKSDSDLYEYLRRHGSSENGSTTSGPQDPVAAACGDPSGRNSAADIGHDLELRRNARMRPASISQSFTRATSRAVSSAIGVASRGPARTNLLRGPMGFFMALFVAFVGVATAVQKKKAQPQTPQKVCTRCEGYGVECCDVCEGRGRIAWEGKLSHTGKCPRCFGSGTKSAHVVTVVE